MSQNLRLTIEESKLRDHDIELAYQNDPVFLRIRAKNLVMPLANLSRARLAEILPFDWQDLAALIACHEFERHIYRVASILDPNLVKSESELNKIINGLADDGWISGIRRGKWHRLRKIRNKFVHEDKRPSEKQTLGFTQEVMEIERDFEGRITWKKS